MLAGQSEALDEALWVAYNVLNESALMAERLAQEARERSHNAVARRFDERAQLQRTRAHVLRGVLGDADHLVPVAENGDTSSTQKEQQATHTEDEGRAS
jgi:two-component system chemotaxis response regulator CheB